MADVLDTLSGAAKATPPLAVCGGILSGVSLSDWVLLATLLYTVLQTYFLLRDRWERYKEKPNGSK